MSLQIKRLTLHNFRNYQDFCCDNLSRLNIFVGPNAVGKTNIVESIDLLTSISSFRNPRISELVGPYENFVRVKTLVEDDHRFLTFEMRIIDGKKTYLLNDKEKRGTQLKGMIPSVVFTPDDLTMIKGSNTNRRRALDSLGSQLSPNYPVIKKDFEQILRQKNNLLKDNPSAAFLSSIDDVFVTYATQLYCYRVSLFEKLTPYISEYYRDISHRGETVTAEYIPSWVEENVSCETLAENAPDPHDKGQVRQLMYNAVEKARFKELAAKHAMIGPHKDAIRFYIDGRDAAIYGSQGQQRSLVLAWKLAEVRLIEEMFDIKPILLLDDVMSELDEVRRNELTKYVLESTQTFITTTNISYFTQEMLNQAHIVHLDYREDSE